MEKNLELREVPGGRYGGKYGRRKGEEIAM